MVAWRKPFEHQVFVHVVRQNPDLGETEQYFAECHQFLGGVGGAGGVVGAVQHQPFGAGRDGGREVVGAKLEAVVLRAGHDHRNAADQPGHERVGTPVGGGDDHLVAVVQRGGEGVVEHALAAVANGDFVQRELQLGIAVEFALDGGLEGWGAVLRRVFGVAAQGGLVGGFDRVRRAREIGLADGEGDHFDALGAHGTGAHRHRHGRGRLRLGQPVGQPRPRARQCRPAQKCWMRSQAVRRLSVSVA